jgi:hypothetical protein
MISDKAWPRRRYAPSLVPLTEREMSPHERSIEEAGVAFEEGLRAVLGAYYDELRTVLTAWDVPLELEEPAKQIFGIARLHAGREPGAVQAWGLTPWVPIANRTPAELLRVPGGDLLLLRAFGR